MLICYSHYIVDSLDQNNHRSICIAEMSGQYMVMCRGRLEDTRVMIANAKVLSLGRQISLHLDLTRSRTPEEALNPFTCALKR